MTGLQEIKKHGNHGVGLGATPSSTGGCNMTNRTKMMVQKSSGGEYGKRR